MHEDTVKVLHLPVAPSLNFFDPRRRYTIPRGTASVGAQWTRGSRKIFCFSTEIPVQLGMGTR